jgi:hypothetical protein
VRLEGGHDELTGRSLEQIEGRLRDGAFRPADVDRLPVPDRRR